jgi:hypothetical protein
LLGIIAALFHDVGLIQEEGDTNGSGAKYTIGHEERSIEFMKVYLSKKKLPSEDITDCSHFIMSTILALPPKEIPFRSEETETVGHVVGSADLLAQMADRLYLEKLLLLFEEFEEARLPGFDTELTLLKKTEDFYRSVAIKRLDEDLGGVYKTMADHFQSRWDMNRDPYEEAIQNNLKYLGSLIDQCRDSYTCYLEGLRRGGITKEILSEMDRKEKP